MDWAVVTWLILLGVVGLLWMMALAVMNDENAEQPSEPSVEERASENSGETAQARRRSAA
ncbi:MAG: hypothetical protein ACREJU_15745 [Nitrospiraceae bacterium]